jgi:hypothetical protein
LKDVRKVIEECREFTRKLNETFNITMSEADTGDSRRKIIGEIKDKLTQNKNLGIIRGQNAKIEEKLKILKEARKKFGDCNIRPTLKTRKTEITKVETMMTNAKAKFKDCKSNIDMLLSLDSTKEEKIAVLKDCQENDIG